MPSQNSSSTSSSSGKGYTTTSSGTNSQGNHYCSRDYGSSASNSNSYHYSNANGSYYYSNPNGKASVPFSALSSKASNQSSAKRKKMHTDIPAGSTYYNNGAGDSTYTPGNQGGK
ncbi:hypothetical protein Q7P37_002676 [Cladosporium fusiforme]